MADDLRSSRKARRREQVREEILEAAGEVVLAKGLNGLTLAAVARELGLTKPALYHYFASKEALVFELVFSSIESHAEFVAAALAESEDAADALERLIRSTAEYYADNLDDLRLSYLVPQVGLASAMQFTDEMLARIRPFNDMVYGPVAEHIRFEQHAGAVAKSLDGRRLAFLAHTAVLGVLTVEGLVDVADDAPLVHAHEAMIDELVATFRARLEVAGRRRR